MEAAADARAATKPTGKPSQNDGPTNPELRTKRQSGDEQGPQQSHGLVVNAPDAEAHTISSCITSFPLPRVVATTKRTFKWSVVDAIQRSKQNTTLLGASNSQFKHSNYGMNPYGTSP